jgi:small subunit ribosomal protein S20
LAHTKSAQKATRVHAKKTERNKPVRSSVRTAVTKARNLLDQKDMDAAKVAVGEASAALDRAAKKGVIHPNNAARRKSRMAKQLNAAQKTKDAPKK